MGSIVNSSTDIAGLLFAIEEDIVTFTFTKKTTGSQRIAEGTRNIDLIPVEHRPKGTGSSKAGSSSVTFYDFTRNQWRSFDPSTVYGQWVITDKSRKYKEEKLKGKLLFGQE